MRAKNIFRYLSDIKKIFILFFIFQINVVFSQKIQTSNEIKNDDLTDIFEILGVSVYKITLPESLKGKFIDININEFIKGELSYHYSIIDSVPGSKERIKYDADNYRIKFISSKGRDKENYESLEVLIENKASFSGYRFNYIKNPLEYRWTSLVDSSADLDFNSEIPLLAFSPFPWIDSKPNYAVFCKLPVYADKYKNWFQIFGLDHYYVVSLKILNN